MCHAADGDLTAPSFWPLLSSCGGAGGGEAGLSLSLSPPPAAWCPAAVFVRASVCSLRCWVSLLCRACFARNANNGFVLPPHASVCTPQSFSAGAGAFPL